MADSVARDDTNSSLLLYRWPSPIALSSRLDVSPRETAVFRNAGAIAAVLPPGIHQLDPASAPFVARLAQGGAVGGELFFVTMAPVRGFRLGGALPAIDPTTQISARPRIMAEIGLQATDASRLVTGLADVGDDSAIGGWVGQLGVKALGAAIERERMSLLSLVDPGSNAQLVELLTNALAAEIEPLGLKVSGVQQIMISLDEDTTSKLREATQKAAAARAAASVAAAAPRQVPAAAPLAAAGAASGAARMLTCPSCRQRVPAGKFCAGCGGSLATAVRCACGMQLPATARFCSECGRAVG